MAKQKREAASWPCGLPLTVLDQGDARVGRDWFYDLAHLITDQHRVKQFVDLLNYVEPLGYFEAPASHKYHMPWPGGLVFHHVNVTLVLLHLKRVLYPTISDESCAIVGLMHDIGKLGTAGRPYYAKSGKKDEPFLKHEMDEKAPVYMSVAARSLAIVSSKIDLSTWEAQAILYHDGQYIDDNHAVRLKESPLTLLLHHADMWAAFQIEQVYPVLDQPFTKAGLYDSRGD